MSEINQPLALAILERCWLAEEWHSSDSETDMVNLIFASEAIPLKKPDFENYLVMDCFHIPGLCGDSKYGTEYDNPFMLRRKLVETGLAELMGENFTSPMGILAFDKAALEEIAGEELENVHSIVTGYIRSGYITIPDIH